MTCNIIVLRCLWYSQFQCDLYIANLTSKTIGTSIQRWMKKEPKFKENCRECRKQWMSQTLTEWGLLKLSWPLQRSQALNPCDLNSAIPHMSHIQRMTKLSLGIWMWASDKHLHKLATTASSIGTLATGNSSPKILYTKISWPYPLYCT